MANLPDNGVGGAAGSHDGHCDCVPGYGAGIAGAPQTPGNQNAAAEQLMQGSAPAGGGLYVTPAIR